IHCFDVPTGMRCFRTGSSDGYVTAIYGDGLCYLRGRRGEMAMAEPQADRVLIRSRFEPPHGREETCTFPVIAGGRLYVRDQSRLLCYDVRSPDYKEGSPIWNIASKVRPATPGNPGPNLAPPKGEPDAIFVPT